MHLEIHISELILTYSRFVIPKHFRINFSLQKIKSWDKLYYISKYSFRNYNFLKTNFQNSLFSYNGKDLDFDS